MSDEGMLERVAVSLGIKPAQLKTSDVHARIPGIRRKFEEYEKSAIAAEAEALKKKEQAFSPETPATERKQLLLKAAEDKKQAETLAGFASTFLSQLNYWTMTETMMQIVDQMKENGLVDEKTTAMDWQKSVNSMQDEIQEMLDRVKKLGDVMGSALTQDAPAVSDTLADELDQLFAKFNAETDPAKKAEIQKQIEVKMSFA